MPIKLEIVGEDYKEFAQNLAGTLALSFPRVAQAVPQPAQAEQAAQAEPAPKKRGRKPKTDAAPETSEAPAEDAAAEEASAADEKVPEPSAQDVKDALMALMTAKGDTAPLDCLKDFGTTKVSGLKPEQYAEVIERAKKLGAG